MAAAICILAVAAITCSKEEWTPYIFTIAVLALILIAGLSS